jgi:hypothetical protein
VDASKEGSSAVVAFMAPGGTTRSGGGSGSHARSTACPFIVKGIEEGVPTFAAKGVRCGGGPGGRGATGGNGVRGAWRLGVVVVEGYGNRLRPSLTRLPNDDPGSIDVWALVIMPCEARAPVGARDRRSRALEHDAALVHQVLTGRNFKFSNQTQKSPKTNIVDGSIGYNFCKLR